MIQPGWQRTAIRRECKLDSAQAAVRDIQRLRPKLGIRREIGVEGIVSGRAKILPKLAGINAAHGQINIVEAGRLRREIDILRGDEELIFTIRDLQGGAQRCGAEPQNVFLF